jgi:hypothetical protein
LAFITQIGRMAGYIRAGLLPSSFHPRGYGESEKCLVLPVFGRPEQEESKKVEKLTGSIRGVCILAAVAAVLALAPAAFAQSSGVGYGGQAGGVAGQVAPGGAPGGAPPGGAEGAAGAGGGGAAAAEARAPEEGGLLAFTGLDVALIVGGGLLLLAGGVALSRVVARNPA